MTEEEETRTAIITSPSGDKVKLTAGKATNIWIVHRCTICKKKTNTTYLPDEPLYNSCSKCRDNVSFLLGALDEFKTEASP